MKKDKPSNTARIVARNIAQVAAADKTGHLVAPEAIRLNAALLKGFSAKGSHLPESASRLRWRQMLFRFYERLTIRGLALHQALRKRHIETLVRAALTDEGFRQVVVIGGGLDTLAGRLCREFPGVNFLEIDHPATQKMKRETIEKLDGTGGNLHFLAVDLTRRTLEECLRKHPAYRADAKTVFVCEGVLMYLSEAQVAEVFDFIKKQAAPRFIFTFMERGRSGRTDFRNSTVLVRLWLKWKKEPFKWGIDAEEMEGFLSRLGFTQKTLATAEDFRRIYLEPNGLVGEPLAEGENLCVAETVC
ncbi:MAG: SAM-dependent methyltransferase [Pyrinomonadaceae bacterium]